MPSSEAPAIRLLDKPSLFAGKASAVVSRNWGHRVKGRDWYDFAYYAESETPLNLDYFWSQLKRYPDYQSMEPTLANAKLLLARRFQEVSIERVQPDVKRFLPLAEQQKIASWSTPYFVQLTETLQAISYPQSRERLVSFAGSSSATDVSHGNSPQSKSEKQPPKPKEK